ncbi:MAG: gamma carbonic anhydrase family protein [Methanosarcinales archaeon]|nr:gamma carbonic anhydrase family protein [Methanosarcinales archaeon]
MKEIEAPLDWPRIAEAPPDPSRLPCPDEGLDFAALWSRPVVHPTAWISPGAVVLGRVRLEAHSSVWYGCVLRGDGQFIQVGAESNVHDGSILHTEPEHPCILGRRVTLGHRATVHAARVEDGAMIGMGATVLSRCRIGEGALVAAGSLVREGTNVPAGTLWAGSPARQIKELTGEQKARLALTSRHYANLAALYLMRFGQGHIDELCRR